MKYVDRIYGEFDITEPVLIDLISGRSLERLKGVDQGGYYEPFMPGAGRSHSRFEHSMGVMLILRKFGAGLEEQISGLIHDVSHSVFSHCIDYVLRGGSPEEQCFQDNIFPQYVRKSEIPEILKKHGIKLDCILDDKNFPLKENELPDLCADRLDYSLRALLIFKMAPREQVLSLLGSLSVIDSHWVFGNGRAALLYARYFRDLNALHYCGLQTAVMFKAVADYLKHAMKKNYIGISDLYTTDREVLRKIAGYHKRDPGLLRLWDCMNNRVPYSDNPNDYETRIACKSRIVDPLFKDKDGTLKRVSQANPDWAKIVKDESAPKEYYLKFQI